MKARHIAPSARGAAGVLLALLLCLALAAQAHGQDRVYWENSTVNTIGFAALDGSDAGRVDLGTAPADRLSALTFDSASQRIYWGNFEDSIGFANLAGTESGRFETGGLAVGSPRGLAIDSNAKRLYWADEDGDTISFGELDGSFAAQLPTGAATLAGPSGLAVDPLAGRLYWSNSVGTVPISFANLDGSGGGDLNVTGSTRRTAAGVAIDRLHGRIYWASLFGGVSFANLDGSGGGDLPTGSATMSAPFGVAIDPLGGRVYWSNRNSAKAPISFANLDGSGGGDLVLPGASADTASFPILIFDPRPVAPPIVSGGPKLGAVLSCSTGEWGADLPEALLYRAPQSFSFQWSRDGVDIPGATGESLTADAIGRYNCRVTAKNKVGEKTQSSALEEILPIAFGQRTGVTLKLSRRLTAKGPVMVQITNANRFEVTGKLSVSRSKKPGPAASFKVAPGAKTVVKRSLPGSLRRPLANRGKLAVTLRAAVSDEAGNRRTVTRAVVLRRKR